VRIRWSRPAVAHLVEIRNFIAEDNQAAARAVARSIIEATNHLGEFPSIGRPGRVPETRELVVPGTPFIIPYRVTGEIVEIIAVFHGARKPPTDPTE